MAGVRLVSTLTLLAGCSFLSGLTQGGVVPDALMALGVSNQTNLTLELDMNGKFAANVPPNSEVAANAEELPPLPWEATVRFPGGRAFVSLMVRSGDVARGGSSSRGDGTRVDLSCGRIDLWSGSPLGGPAPGPGAPGDCEP
jgi:hypothetical protein